MFNNKQNYKYKRQPILISTFSIIFLFFIIISCQTTEPPKQQKFNPGNRNYSWTEDTLDINNYESLAFRNIVGNSAEDIWVGTLDASKNVGLWHYDGIEWKSVDYPGYAASALWLFNDNTLWVGSKESKIWKMENGVWSEPFNLKLDNYDIIMIFGFFAHNKKNIYAVGWAVKTIVLGYEYEYKGVILHFDGYEWTFIDIPVIKDGFHDIFYQDNIKTHFIFGTEGMIDKLYTFDGKNIKEILSTFAEIGLSEINGYIYINSERIIYTYHQGKLALWKDFSGTGFQSSFVGRSETDFINNSDGGIGHYNGINYKTIYKTNLMLMKKVIFEKDVFCLSEDLNTGKDIIIHGIIKE